MPHRSACRARSPDQGLLHVTAVQMLTGVPSWILLALASAATLGLYDVTKKASADRNAVFATLFACTMWGGVVVLPWLAVARLAPDWAAVHGLSVGSLGVRGHLFVLAKAGIVTLSWTLSFLALQKLPLTIASPIRATAPLYTLLGAIVLFGEAPTGRQWTGIALVFAGHFAFSVLGKAEGIRFSTSPRVWALLAGTVVGSVSALWDKNLLQREGLDPAAMQVWFTLYNVGIQGALWLAFGRGEKGFPFQWRWTMPATGVLLLVADAFYFRALAEPEALVAIVSSMRRGNVLVGFVIGGIAFRERNRRRKAFALLLLLGGLALLV